MIELNSVKKTLLEFELNIENTTKDPKEVRFIIPLKEDLNLMVSGKYINKSAVISVPPIGDIIEGEKIEGAKLEIILNEEGIDTIFEAAREDIKVTKPVKIEAKLSNSELIIPEKCVNENNEETSSSKGPIQVSATVKTITEQEDPKESFLDLDDDLEI